jgi:hypothetical protein
VTAERRHLKDQNWGIALELHGRYMTQALRAWNLMINIEHNKMPIHWYLMNSVNSKPYQAEWDACTNLSTTQCRPNSWTLQFSELDWVRAARTRAPSATNYDVYASRGKILESPDPKCNGAGCSRPSTLLIMDWPRPGKYLPRLLKTILYVRFT